jgi:hypothetical protein
MDAELTAAQKPLSEPLQPHGLQSRRLTDEEIIARGFEDETLQFEVPEEIIPAGMVYQWFRTEVYGMPDTNRRAQRAERNGWRPVPASRHDGLFMPPGHQGAIELEGQRLYELPENEAYNRHRGAYLKSKLAKQNANAMLATAPSGTGPRNHPGIAPSVRVTRMPISDGMAIE